MSCQVIRNTETNEIEKVLAPNKKESILYKDINEYTPSKEEALLTYAQIYTPSFKEWFDDVEGGKEFVGKQTKETSITSQAVDENGEPKVEYVKSFSKKSDNIYANLNPETAVDFSLKEANGELNDPITAEAIKELQDDNLITKVGTALNNFTINEYTVENVNKVQNLLESKNIEYKRIGDNIKIYGLPQYNYSYNFTTLDSEEDQINNIKDLKEELGITSKAISVSEFNDIARSLKAYNQQNETNYLIVADQILDGSIVVKTIVEDKTLNRSTLSVTQELTDRLKALFPELQIQYINEDEIAKYSGGRFNNSDVIVNSFIKDGIVYLVRNRFTGDMMVEEFLHPFTSAIMFDNSTLANSLYAEILDRYPDIVNMVERTYTDERGYNDDDRKNEIITKGLQRAFSEKIQDSFKAKDRNIK